LKGIFSDDVNGFVKKLAMGFLPIIPSLKHRCGHLKIFHIYASVGVVDMMEILFK
jgi:hypothetical protein